MWRMTRWTVAILLALAALFVVVRSFVTASVLEYQTPGFALAITLDRGAVVVDCARSTRAMVLMMGSWSLHSMPSERIEQFVDGPWEWGFARAGAALRGRDLGGYRNYCARCPLWMPAALVLIGVVLWRRWPRLDEEAEIDRYSGLVALGPEGLRPIAARRSSPALPR